MIILLSENQQRLLESIDYKGFLEKDSLCYYLFHDNLKMKEEVASRLMKIARDFYDFLQLDWLPDMLFDVQLVGSLASYNWSEIYSDLDLHIVIDYSKISSNKNLVESDFWALKTLYNLEHDISIKGFDVEVYVQDIHDDIKSNGIFSIMRQTWIKKPEKLKPQIDKRRIESIVTKIKTKIREILGEYRLGNYDYAQEMAEKLMEDIMSLRKKGLSGVGEFSPENLAFKTLRREGLIKQLVQIERDSFDGAVSYDKSVSEKIALHKKEMEKKMKRSQEKVGKTKNIKIGKPFEKHKDGIQYKIMGRSFGSLRDAAKALGIPHSTLNYRINSKNPKWGSYKKITIQK